jgi:MarR family transcriptional regulator, organic hydroperoxide resistance regulator
MKSNGKLELDEFIGHLQLVAFLTRQYIERRFIEEATEKPLSYVHMNLLRILDTRPGETVGDIAQYMKVSYPAATKTIDKLVRLGLLKRREDTQDRRIAHLHLTPSGKKMVDKYDSLKMQEITRILEDFGAENALNLNKQMHDLSAAIVKLAPITKSVCLQCGAYDPDECQMNSNTKTCGFLDARDAE